MKNQFFRRYWVVIWGLCLCCTLLFASTPSYALRVQDVPNPRQQNGGWVTDMVDMLSPQGEAQLNQMISQLERENGTEIAVVTVPTTKPSPTPKAFTTELFNTWGIGKKGKDNGVLFLVSKGERRTEIETGYGIEGILPDAKVVSILRTQVTPQFKKGKFETGILAGTRALIRELGTEIPSSVTNSPNGVFLNNFFSILIPIGLLAAFMGFNLFTDFLRPKILKNYLSPSGATRRSHITGKVYCQTCSQQMQQVEATELESYLNEPQKVARKLGSAKFQGWRCPGCAKGMESPQIHLLIRELHKASRCPTCEELTVTNQSTEVVKAATKTTTGIRRKRGACQCCSYTSLTLLSLKA